MNLDNYEGAEKVDEAKAVENAVAAAEAAKAKAAEAHFGKQLKITAAQAEIAKVKEDLKNIKESKEK